MTDYDFINSLCREIAEETLDEHVKSITESLEDELYLAMYSRYAHYDDCDGPWYWELK